MPPAKFIVSLDFELFWGVSATQTVASYGRNVLGEWHAIPRLLALFRRHQVKATWATVGMLMCRNYKQWRAMRPAVLPGYARANISPYVMERLVKEHAKLFFARPLVEQIIETTGQELATHTYSHFYCNEPGATPEQFAADLACARAIGAEMGLSFRSLVLPRNQIVEKFLSVLPDAGIHVYRGNSNHWLYRNGDAVAGGIAGRIARFADACIPLSGQRTVHAQVHSGLVNVPASLFLYPLGANQRSLSLMRLDRLKRTMTSAARAGGIFHLWWHPHNFGVNTDENFAQLEAVLRHYHFLADTYGMRSHSMGEFAPTQYSASLVASDTLSQEMEGVNNQSIKRDQRS
ncbi:polysaccharide deacetylase family protein [Massilia sp. S19_KUP03_FR1]|uniref:polysaccharide deacetylase family protein n=1 Tax=Massilia sp. S19_KUP03_FR1 TaxID=3025503 RepID=UPI002FCD81D9